MNQDCIQRRTMGNQDQIRKIELKWEYSGSGCGTQNDMHPLRIIQYHGFL